MAKFVTITFALLCLITVSLTETSPENDGVANQASLALPESSRVVSLPKPDSKKTEATADVVKSPPLTKLTFHPINRHFPVRPKLHSHHHYKVYLTMRENEEIPDGNDMIVSSGENGDFADPAFHRERQRSPGRWVRVHQHRDEDSDSDDDEDEDRIEEVVFKRYDYDRFDREKRLKVLKKLGKHFRLQNEEEEKKKKKCGFMKKLRKFLDHYF